VFWHSKQQKYVFRKSDGSARSPAELVEFWESWVRQFPLITIEDGMAENDWAGWKELTRRLGDKIQLIGDDIFVTNNDSKYDMAIKEVKKNGLFVVPGLGRLVRVERKARMGRNPATGETIKIAAKKVVKLDFTSLGGRFYDLRLSHCLLSHERSIQNSETF
jgi:enolase